jgi:hypothetical protein
VTKSWDHTWEKPTEYQMEQVKIAAKAAREEPYDGWPFAENGRAQSPTLRIWEALERERERWRIT